MMEKRRISLETNVMVSQPMLGVRHLQCFLIFCGLCLIYAMRVNLSMAIVAMMDNAAANPNFPEYAWSQQTKSHILSSFFCGYILAQVPSGHWARRFGGRLLLCISMTVSSTLALLTPLSVSRGGWPLLCALRFFQGLFQGATYPTVATIMAKWAPIEERSAMLTYCCSGLELGISIMLAISGVLCSSSWGWPSTFYIPGGLGLLWAIVWFVFGASTPNDCKYISAAERTLINTSLRRHAKSEECNTAHAVPWKHIVTSRPFLVLVLSQCASSWCFWTLLTQIPSYIKSVLGKDIQSNAFYSALPYLTMLAVSLVLCPLVSYLEKSKRLNATVSRKLFNTIGQWIPAATLVYLGYLRTDQGDLAITLLTLTVTISTVTHFGYQVNHLDLSPHFAGTLMGIANSAANVMSIIAPLIVGYIVTDATNLHQWRIIFILAGGISFFGNLMFVFFGTAKVQWWNEGSQMSRGLKHNGDGRSVDIKSIEIYVPKSAENVSSSRETLNLD
ncbi:PREDICTED: putative inorganic phosphate cotransporter [Rhagoletis zephyria]|uniref:putative inorganic phosphate cotransporter n=1 Tax=Rhagoletis zephyria TaxID=28612 RepID=UPI000811552B|nr:PREDICTED: putative inorganic phosphate cotransporter [Rhagoletis zephyria]